MFGIHAHYVKATEGQIEGRVFPIKPGCESEAIEVFRTVVDRCAEKAGRGDERPEMLGIFIASDTIQNLIPDGTHEPFLVELLLEYKRLEAIREGGKRDETEV